MLFFDHLYCLDRNHRFLKQLELAGFTPQPSSVHHPGAAHCRFIRVAKKMRGRNYHYLEFVSTPNQRRSQRPGLSFRAGGELEKLFQKMRRQKKYGPHFFHRNYQWQRGRARAPGWNYLRFRRLGFRGIYPWITEYEPNPAMPPQFAPKHKIETQVLVGLVLSLNPKGEEFFTWLLGKPRAGYWKLACGTKLFWRPGRANRVEAVALQVADFRAAVRKAKGMAQPCSFRGKPALRLKNPAGSWDVLLV